MLRSRAYDTILILSFFLVIVQNSTHSTSASNDTFERWDRLLIEEFSSLKENIIAIDDALDKKNYTAAMEQINDIESAGNWYDIRKELESRGQVDLISNFHTSISKLDKLVLAKDSNSLKQTQILYQDIQNIERSLGRPVVDFQRLLLVILVIGTLMTFGLYIVPRVRKKFDVKF